MQFDEGLKFMRAICRVTAVMFIFHCFVVPVAADELEAAHQANIRGDFKTAIQLYKPLAEVGNLAARVNLAHIYYKGGKDVPANYVESAKWMKLAADQGNLSSQTLLGLMYCQGKGVPRDYLNCFAWITVATDRGDPTAIKVYPLVLKSLTSPQIVKAQRIAHDWENAHPKSMQPGSID